MKLAYWLSDALYCYSLFDGDNKTLGTVELDNGVVRWFANDYRDPASPKRYGPFDTSMEAQAALETHCL